MTNEVILQEAFSRKITKPPIRFRYHISRMGHRKTLVDCSFEAHDLFYSGFSFLMEMKTKKMIKPGQNR